ncbi:LysR family transcriptional regulator [Tropicimonas isoalkanivorans]|uniref:DNA-binding transcriptional regulator, LysR family n=1 Tax=Tropicimonas isoalkanivorans TaxID=441112 RepID=A0A1I1N753_9RHOB|nr:LysR family transcriptional regulator [Tropicimonas isoalkanivorans]SFC91298.1 DNA-binding transcriptional regulator, LysR family [Tropicimonas isoalkanivorans]
MLVSRHLENFLALYEARSTHEAARRKGISQPALTSSLKLIERAAGGELFTRSARGLEPTEAGTALHRHALAIDQHARFASMDISTVQNRLGGRIRVGVGPVLAVSSFPDVVVRFHREFPDVAIDVESGISSQLVDRLGRDQLDLIVTARPTRPMSDAMIGLPLFRSEMVVVCREGHPLTAGLPVTPDALTDYSRVGFTEDLEFEEHSRSMSHWPSERLRPILQTSSISVMFGVLAATDHFAIVSHVLVPKARREGLVRLDLTEPLWQIEVEAFCKTSLSGSRPIKALQSILSDDPPLTFE